jgi:hypothetical protein
MVDKSHFTFKLEGKNLKFRKTTIVELMNIIAEEIL